MSAPVEHTRLAEQAFSAGLAALSRVTFSDSDAGEIFRVATAAVGGLGPCQFEASYRSVNGEFIQFPPSQPAHRDIEQHRRSNWDGQVESKDGRWIAAPFVTGWRASLSSPATTSARSIPGSTCTPRRGRGDS